MKTRMDGQVAIVTGGAQGIGLGIARLLAARGAKVVVWDRDLAPLEGGAFRPDHAESFDVTSYPSMERAFGAVVARFGQVHIVVNNAGINGPIKPAWEYPLEDWDRVIAVDMTAVFYLSRLAAAHMRGHGYGRIVTVASIAGKEGVQNLCAYSAAKAGAAGLVRSIAREAGRFGVLSLTAFDVLVRRQMTERAVGPLVIVAITGTRNRLRMKRRADPHTG